MQGFVKTFDNTLQVLVDFRKMPRMAAELLALIVWVLKVPFGWMH